jgi:hypothetical protein
MGAGRPRILTERAYAAARQVLDHGGWTGLDPATTQAVRDGPQPGDPLPPLQPHPYIDNVTGADVIITGTGPQRRVAVLFFHQHFPASASATGSPAATRAWNASNSRKRSKPAPCIA